ncbi:unnamed protein product [Caenorhabditis sp. 36 PRJEB53466]|nr:unnamed protein product [Caenorhabditis sp. 36 PRJEB53466]
MDEFDRISVQISALLLYIFYPFFVIASGLLPAVLDVSAIFVVVCLVRESLNHVEVGNVQALECVRIRLSNFTIFLNLFVYLLPDSKLDLNNLVSVFFYIAYNFLVLIHLKLLDHIVKTHRNI